MSRQRAASVGVVAISLLGLLAACSDSAREATSASLPVVASDESIPVETPATVEVDPDACSPNDTDGSVTLWHSMGGPAATDLWAELEADFDSSHSMKLEVLTFGGDDAIVNELAVTPRDEWPDLIDVSEQNTQTLLDTHQFLLPASCDPSLGEDLLPLIRATYSVNDQLLAMPFAVSTPVLIFDAAEFRAAGLDVAAPPLTMDDLLAASQTLVDSGTSPYGLVLTDWCANLVLDQFSAKTGVAVGGGENGHDLGAVTVDFATPENEAALTALAEGVVAGHVSYLGGSENNLNDLIELSNTTDASGGGGTMAVHTSGALGDVIRLLGNYPGVELGVGPLPGPGSGALVGGNAMWLVDNSDAEQAGRASTVLQWLYEPQRLARLAIDAGFVPPTEAAAQDPALVQRWVDYPQLKVAYDQVMNTPVTAAAAGVLVGPFVGRSRVLYQTCEKIMSGGANVTATLQWATNAVNELLQSYAATRAGEPSDPTISDTVLPPPAAVEISGTAECASGAPVVGIYVTTEVLPDGNGGWAEYDASGASKVAWRFALKYGGRYQLHVGCGGTLADWGSESFTMFVSESNDFLCHDDPPKRGSCDTL